MKKTNQKSKLKIFGILSSALIGSFVCITAASAQTTTGIQHPGSVHGTQQISQQQIVKEKSSTLQQVQPVPAQNRVPIMVGGQVRTVPHGAPTTSGTATSKQPAAPASMEQLKYQRKQAAAKGQSTEIYDKAIQEQLTNQAK